MTQHFDPALLAPIPGPEGHGREAKEHPTAVRLREEIAKLDSLSGGDVSWTLVESLATELLKTETKDIRVACQLAHAWGHTQSIHGLRLGLGLVHDLMEQYWDGIYPQRPKGRASAVVWLVERTAVSLATGAITTTDTEAITQLTGTLERLRSALEQRLGDNAPALQPLLDALTRAGTAGHATASSQTDVTTSASTSSPSVGAAPPTQSSVAPPEIEPAAASSATVVHPRQWALRWTAPISATAPQGQDLRNDTRFLSIREAILMADHPAGKPPDWQGLVSACDSVLIDLSKDLRSAAFRAYAAYRATGLDGLAEALSILGALLEVHWDGLFPSLERSARARASAIAWLLPRLDNIGSHAVTADDEARVERLGLAASYVVEQIQTRFSGGDAPATRPLLEQVERLRLSIPRAPTVAVPVATTTKDATPPATSHTAKHAPTAEAHPAQQAAPVAAQPASTVHVASAPPSRPSSVDVSEVRAYVRTLGRDLMQIADQLLEADAAAPEGYRLARIAMYGAINVDPPAPSGRITVASPQFALGGLERLTEAHEWAQLLNAAEKTARTNPFLLDAQRFVVLALERLGASFAPARAVVLGELAALLERAPTLLELNFSDGKPLAQEATREWVRSVATLGGTSRSSDTSEGGTEVAKGRSLAASGKTKEALALLEQAAQHAASQQASFRARLAMAEVAVSIRGANAFAEGLYAALVETADRHQLDDWEPNLAFQLMAGYLRCLRAFPKEDRLMADRSRMIYRRLCRIDPVRALATAEDSSRGASQI